MNHKKANYQEETIEGFRVPKTTSKRLHAFLESEGITKKKWLESKLDDDLDYKALLNVNKTSSVLIPKIHYARLLATSSTAVDSIPLVRFLVMYHFYLKKIQLGKII